MIRRSLAAAIAALLLLPGAALARSANITDAHVSLGLAPNASLLVKERLTFDYQGSYQASYRDIVLKHGETVTDISVSEEGQSYRPGGCTTFGCSDQQGVFGATSIGGGARVVWHHHASDENRTFTVSYRVIDAVVAYDDVIDVGWAVWGDQWDFVLPTLSADLKDPALVPSDPKYRVWGHPRDVEGRTARDPGEAKLEATNVPSGTAVEFRVTIPRTPGQGVGAARPGQGNGLEKILAEEKDLDENFNSPLQKAKRWIGHHAKLLALILAGLTGLALLALRVYTRERDVSTPEHLPEPPDDATPAVAYGLAYEGGSSNNTVLATLLDLIERDFYDTKQATTDKEKLDLSVSKAEMRPDVDKLEDYEKEVLTFFDALLEDDSVPFSEMKDRIPEHDSTWRSRWQNMTGALNDADEGKLKWDRNANGLRALLGLGVVLLFGALTVVYAIVEDKWFLPAAIGSATFFFVVGSGGTKLKRLAPEYRERASKWQAFEKWTQDFPRLKDDPPATLDLWKKILIYGVAFGTAQRMIDSGRIPAPVMEAASGGWSYYMFNTSGSSSGFDGNSFSSGFSSQVAPESSGGGGGGFSGGGGGGGFSGGGGGGSW